MTEPDGQHDNTDKGIRDLERLTESLVQANRHVLTAQVILNDRQDTFEENLKRLTVKMDALVDAQKAQGERIDKLVVAIGEAQKDQAERVDKLVVAVGELVQRMPPT